MTDAETFTEPAVVTLPAEIDVSNAGALATRLRAAIDTGARVVIVDLTTTDFCDSSGVRILLLARDWSTADDAELRLVAPPGPTLVVLKLTRLDQLLPVYSTLGEALAAQPGPDGQPPPADIAKPQTEVPRSTSGSPQEHARQD